MEFDLIYSTSQLKWDKIKKNLNLKDIVTLTIIKKLS